jgi:hypothetical protein
LSACGRQVGGEESRHYNHIYISRKPRPVGGELHSDHGTKSRSTTLRVIG